MNTDLVTRRVAIFVCAAGLALSTGMAQAQASYPVKPVKVIVPFAAGGTTTILARLLAERMGQSMGQPFVVDNRPGAGGNVGMDLVAKAEPDGYTILMGPIGLAINPALYAKMPFDPIKNLAPIGLYAGVPNLLVVHPSVPAANVKELIAHAKANPGKLNYASNGNGTSSHLAAEMLKSAAGVEITHVPYKGGGPAMQDLLGKQISSIFATPISAGPHIKAGRIRALAVTSAQRTDFMPEVPTVAESGYPGFEATNWYAYVLPSKTPNDLLERWNRELVKVLNQAEVRKALLAQGMEPAPSTRAELAAYIRREYDTWARVVKEANITAN